MLTLQTCTVRQLESCMFEGANLPGWEIVYIDYIDLAGLAATEEYSLLVAIHNITARIEAVPNYVHVQKECIKHFGKYHPVATEKLAKFGYQMPTEISNAGSFLNSILSKEKRWRQELRQANDKLQKLKQPEGSDLKKAARAWGKTVNEIGKRQGYRIDRNTTFMDEYALMIREMVEEAEQAEIADKFKDKP